MRISVCVYFLRLFFFYLFDNFSSKMFTQILSFFTRATQCHITRLSFVVVELNETHVVSLWFFLLLMLLL